MNGRLAHDNYFRGRIYPVDMSGDWPVIESERAYENPYFSVERERVELPDGRHNDYYRIEFDDDGVIALGVHDGDVLFVDIYRPRLQEQLLELPGGGIDAGESPEEAARREFAEETGYVPETSRHLGSFYFSAWTKSKRHVVWVDEFEPIADTESEAEIQSVRRVPVEEAFDQACESPAGEWNITPLVLADREGLIDVL